MCPKGTRAEARPRGDWPRQPSGMHHGWWMVDGGDESGAVEDQALTFRRERKNGPIPIEVRSLRPCRRALQHCFVGQRGCNNDGTFAVHGGGREGGRREEETRRNNPGMQKEQTGKA